MKIATCFGSGVGCLVVLFSTQVIGETTPYTTPEAQKAKAQLSQPAGPPRGSASDTRSQNSDQTTVPEYGSNRAADNRPVQPIYENSAASGDRPMREMRSDSPSISESRDVRINSSTSAPRGEIGVWLVENGGQGVRVDRLVRNGAGDRAGLRIGDIIMQVNGASVASPRTAAQQIREVPIGQAANLTLVRDGAQQQLQVTLAAGRPGQSYQVGYGGDSSSDSERSMTNSDKDRGALAERTAKLEQQVESMTKELQQMREQMSSMKASGAASSATGTEPSSTGIGTTPSASTPTSSGLTPSLGGSDSSSSTPSPTPATGAGTSGSTTPSASGSGVSDQDLFGGSASPSSTTPASGASK